MGNFTLTPELKEKIIAKAMDKGSAFLTGSPTTVFTTVSNVAETTGQVMGSAAAVPFKAMNTAADLMELVPAVSTIMIADISAYLGMRLGEAVGEMAALPTPADILGKLVRVTVLHKGIIIKRNGNNLLLPHSAFYEVVVKQIEQQKALATPSDSGNNLDKTVLFLVD